MNDCKDKCAQLRSPLPYERTSILRATGITEAQRSTLKQLGAIDGD
ncbi:hypothetical protein [Leptothermofonsia sp. ETS-13]